MVPRPGRWSSPVLSVLRAGFGAALLVYVLKSGGAWASLQSLLSLWWLVVAINLAPVFGASIEARRLAVLFGAHGLTVRFWTGFRVVAIGALFNLLIPGGTGGDVMKLYYLAGRHKGRGVEVATILLVDRVVALFAMLVVVLGLVTAQLPTLGRVPTVRGTAIGVAASLALLLSGVAILWSARIRESAAYRRLMAWLPLGRFLARAADAAFAFRTHKSALLKAALLSLAGHTILVGTLALMGRVLLPSVPTLLVCTLALLGLIASAIPITPGGVGVGEAAAEALFRSVGVPGGAALVAGWRAGMIGICIIGAVLYAVDVKVLRRAGAGPD
jgi:uncharacterized protein (TIRG00374 family)